MDPRLIYLGATAEGPLPGSLSALHIILWKFIVIAFTRADTANEEFKPESIWRSAIRRFVVRLMAYAERVRLWRIKLRTPTIPPRARDRHTTILAPCALIDEEGFVSWTPHASLTFTQAECRCA